MNSTVVKILMLLLAEVPELLMFIKDWLAATDPATHPDPLYPQVSAALDAAQAQLDAAAAKLAAG